MGGAADGFLARIREAPEDDGPRLVYADWLDDLGDPRGQLIRVQVALARLPEFDPRRAGLARAEKDLLDRFVDEWAAPFRGLASGPVFRRGFVEEVKVTARQFLARPDALFAAGPVRHVHLLDVGNHLGAVFAFRRLSRLTGLTVYAQHLGELLARAVAESPHLTGLRELHLGRNRLGDAGAGRLAASPHLGGVEELDLGENDIGEAGARVLASGPRWESLRRLDLAGNAIGPAGLAALAGSPHLPRLERLGLAGSGVGGRFAGLVCSSGVARLTAIDLSANGLTAADLDALFGDRPAAVRDLDLSHNDLGDAGARWLAGASAAAGLRALRLAANGVTDDGLTALAGSDYLSRLAVLDVGNNPVGDEGVRAVLGSPSLRHLRRFVPPAVGLSFRVRLALETRFPSDGRAAP